MELAPAAPALLTRSEAAIYLHLKKETLDIWATTGRYGLPFVKIGRKAMYARSALDEFMSRRTATSTTALRDRLASDAK